MDAASPLPLEAELAIETRQAAYDPNNLSPQDEAAREIDDVSDGIDWDEIIATTQDDFLAGRFAFNSEDYETQEEADAALDAWLLAIAEKVERETTSVSACDADGQ